MKQQRTRVPLHNGSVRHRHVLSTELCPAEGQKSDFLRFELMRHLVDTPDLATCGPAYFQRLVIKHDGEKWVAEMEAIVKEQTNAQQQQQSPEHAG